MDGLFSAEAGRRGISLSHHVEPDVPQWCVPIRNVGAADSILCVEDNPTNRLVTATDLDEMGLRWEEAEDRAIALEKLGTKRYA